MSGRGTVDRSGGGRDGESLDLTCYCGVALPPFLKRPQSLSHTGQMDPLLVFLTCNILCVLRNDRPLDAGALPRLRSLGNHF